MSPIKYEDTARGKREGRSGKPTTAPRRKMEFRGYVSCELTTEEKEQVKALAEAGKITVEDFLGLAMSGYTISAKEDVANDCYMASITDTNPDSAFYGYALSGRGSSLHKAIHALIYKQLYVLAGDWGEGRPSGGDYA